jgi:starch synthase
VSPFSSTPNQRPAVRFQITSNDLLAGVHVKVLFVTIEMSPLAKVGGLADVAGSLPKALVRAGHDVRVITPRHGVTDPAAHGFTPTEERLSVRIAGGGDAAGAVLRGTVGGVPVYLIDIPSMFDRGQVYGEADDSVRWLVFCDAVVAWLEKSTWRPDLIHLNEWHSAFVASRLREQPESVLGRLPRVYTIHNLAIHGGFDDSFAHDAGFGPRQLEPLLASESWMPRSGMGQGILWCDLINTVSPTYAREILEPEYGAGFDPLLRARREDLSGILNGIDYEEFNPATDPRLPANFDAEHYSGHAANKAALQERLGLAGEPETPLIGMVTRLFFQKGADLAVEAIEHQLARRALQFTVLGTGDQGYHEQLLALAERHRGRVAVELAFDADLAQRIYGGTDMFLMPSRFEPCGLGQMIALRYGSVPVVRRTGGLADTVREAADGNGFVFDLAVAPALSDALNRALDAFLDAERWRGLVERGMRDDNSWGVAAKEYERLYDRAIERAVIAQNPARG